MNKEEIFLRLKDIFNLIVGENKTEITLQTKIIDDLCLSSVAMIYMVFAIEKTFKISLSKIKHNTFNTVEDIVELIYNKIH